MYKCKKCNKAVIVLPDGKQIKACDCNTTIVMDLESTMIGSTKIVQK